MNVILEMVPGLVFALFFFGLIESYVRRFRGEAEQHPLTFMGLLVVLLVLDPWSKLTHLLIGIVIAGPTWYVLYRRSHMRKSFAHPETLMLEFCTPGSVALAGGLGGVFMGLFLYSIGTLGDVEYWSEVGVWKLGLYPFIGGAFVGLLRRSIRGRWPKPVWVPYTYRPGMGAAGSWSEGLGLWLDEIVLTVVCTPFLWYALMQVEVGWSALFMVSLILPTFIFYLLWSFLGRFWLRHVGRIVRSYEMLFKAYETLVKEAQIARWLGGLSIEWNQDGYEVSGLLPSGSERGLVKNALERLSPSVDVSGISTDPELQPNPWFSDRLFTK